MADFFWNARAVTEAVRRGAAQGLADAGKVVLDDSQKRVPTESHELADSAVVDVDASDLVAVVSYDTAYAVKQHENLRLKHSKGKQGKYLERALRARREAAARAIAAAISEVIR